MVYIDQLMVLAKDALVSVIHHGAMKTCGEVEAKFFIFFTSY
jgi:hypothetical protein